MIIIITPIRLTHILIRLTHILIRSTNEIHFYCPGIWTSICCSSYIVFVGRRLYVQLPPFAYLYYPAPFSPYQLPPSADSAMHRYLSAPKRQPNYRGLRTHEDFVCGTLKLIQLPLFTHPIGLNGPLGFPGRFDCPAEVIEATCREMGLECQSKGFEGRVQ